MMCVFGRLMSQLADVNTQSTSGMFQFYNEPVVLPVPVAQYVKPLLIDHSACWPDGLMAVANLGSNAGLEGVFQPDWTSGHAVRLNSRTGREGSPVSSLNCDRPLHSGIRAPETVMSMDGQITDSVRPYAPHRSL